MQNHTISDEAIPQKNIDIFSILPLKATRDTLKNQMLRVDHAGEFGAVHIYRGQMCVFEHTHNTQDSFDKIKKMQTAEYVHLNKFNEVLPHRRIRPSLLSPVWEIGGFVMGAVTALVSEKSAFACTEAVETVIDKHYETQINYFAQENPPDALLSDLKQFQQDELDHKHEAIENHSQNAQFYNVTKFLIETLCHTVIKIAHKV